MMTAARHVTMNTLLLLGASACNPSDSPPGNQEDLKLGTATQEILLGSALGNGLYNGTTCGMSNAVTPSCTVSNASDLSFSWTAPYSDIFTFRISASSTQLSLDSVLVISPFDSPNQQLICRNDRHNEPGESASLSLTAGQQIIITVDGYAGLCGGFRLDISSCSASCTGTCQTGACNAAGQCILRQAGSSCSDGDSCTSGDACDATGTCIPGAYTCCLPYNPNYCDPALYCEMPDQYVTCPNGVQQYAWVTPDCRYCINRDACSDPMVCPF